MAGVGDFLSGLAGGMQTGMSIKKMRQESEAGKTADATASKSAQQSMSVTPQQPQQQETGAMGMPTSFQGYTVQQPMAQQQTQQAAQASKPWGFLSSLIGGDQ